MISGKLGDNFNRRISIQNMSEDNSKPVIEADSSQGVKVNAGIIAKPFRDEIKKKVEAMKQEGIGESLR